MSTFTETADIETSSEDYAKRFSGSVGSWLLKIQEQSVLSCLKKHSNIKTILEVAGGHGQLAKPLADTGYQLTVIGSDDICKERIKDLVNSQIIKFKVGDLINLPFADKSIDAVISVRFISHCNNWQQLINELCRVAKICVIIDYPPIQSFNFLYPLLFKLKKKYERNTRTFSIFSEKQIVEAFRRNGFKLNTKIGQFFMPIVFHRFIKLPLFSNIIEYFTKLIGLNYIFGSPAIVEMLRD